MTALETRNAKIAALTVTHNAEQRLYIAEQEPLVKDMNEAGNVIVGLIGQIRDDTGQREAALTPEQKQLLTGARGVQEIVGARLETIANERQASDRDMGAKVEAIIAAWENGEYDE